MPKLGNSCGLLLNVCQELSLVHDLLWRRNLLIQCVSVCQKPKLNTDVISYFILNRTRLPSQLRYQKRPRWSRDFLRQKVRRAPTTLKFAIQYGGPSLLTLSESLLQSFLASLKSCVDSIVRHFSCAHVVFVLLSFCVLVYRGIV